MHLAAQWGSSKLVSLLLSAGASPIRCADQGEPREYAKEGRKTSIIRLLEEAQRTRIYNLNTIVINGREVSLNKLNQFKGSMLVFEAQTQIPQTPRSRTISISTPRSSPTVVDPQILQNQVLTYAIHTNGALFHLPKPQESETAENASLWEGILRFPEADGEWISEFCRIKKHGIEIVRDESEEISFSGLFAFGVFSHQPTHVSLYFRASIKDKIRL